MCRKLCYGWTEGYFHRMLWKAVTSIKYTFKKWIRRETMHEPHVVWAGFVWWNCSYIYTCVFLLVHGTEWSPPPPVGIEFSTCLSTMSGGWPWTQSSCLSFLNTWDYRHVTNTTPHVLVCISTIRFTQKHLKTTVVVPGSFSGKTSPWWFVNYFAPMWLCVLYLMLL
jgi:hypothetical protein